MATDRMETEGSVLQGPLVSLNSVFRSGQKDFDKDLSTVLTAIGGLEKKSLADASSTLEKLASKLQGMKRKLNESSEVEKKWIQKSVDRSEWMKLGFKAEKADDDSNKAWKNQWLQSLILQHLLRSGYTRTAQIYSKTCHLEALGDEAIFAEAGDIKEALLKQNVGPALQWCALHRSQLRKQESTFEFNLRIQEFIELVRKNSKKDAIAYAKKNLASYSEGHLKEIQQALTLLAFPPTTTCEPYKSLYQEWRWEDLVSQFEVEHLQLYHLNSISPLLLNLEAGIGALKTTSCYCMDESDFNQNWNRNSNCPVCVPDFATLAAPLPFALHTNSSLVCRISGQIMNDNNPPMLLPNGFAYSRQALVDMAEQNDGKITCPRTKEAFSIPDLKKMYIS
eukprot:TRINITY_DN21564_c0_g1_i1.p1 TRINITY_DN21564_c0_g1~~TRINITY_DN21564_c0_g1_i1.p1  ORF type:complete len:394 (-),score=63.56 TRINITY_DN21564_c0_g1_i1:71-1252(-)